MLWVSLPTDQNFAQPERTHSPPTTRAHRERRPIEWRQPRSRNIDSGSTHRRGSRRGGRRGRGAQTSPVCNQQLPSLITRIPSNDARNIMLPSEATMEQLRISIDEFNQNISRVFVPKTYQNSLGEVQTYRPATNQVTAYPGTAVREVSLLFVTKITGNNHTSATVPTKN